MVDIAISRDHSIDTGILKGRLDELAADLKKKYGIRSRWDGDTCLLDGAGVKKGVLKITDSNLSVELTLGMLAKILKPKIEEEINKKIGGVLTA